MKTPVLSALIFLLAGQTFAGGTPEQVKLPEGYRDNFTEYDHRNRLGGNQVAKIYGNTELMKAIAATGNPVQGAKIVMEIYSPELDKDGNPVKETSGIYKTAKLGAIAVMEYRDNWGKETPASERSGPWAFALYAPDGTAKENDLNCAGCHNPLHKINYLFSIMQLKNFVSPETQ